MKTFFYSLDEMNIGLRAAIVADIHNRNITDALETVTRQHPDLILIPGDLMEAQNTLPRYAPHPNAPNENGMMLLRELVKLAPVFYSTGNHETPVDEEHRMKILSTGAILLENRYVPFQDLLIGGVSSNFENGSNFYTPAPDIPFLEEFASQPGKKILLSHHPELYDRYIRNYPFDAVISGHAHGGQWRLGRLAAFAPGQGIFPKYTKGIYDHRLVVSPGMANHTSIPRIFNPPALILLTL